MSDSDKTKDAALRSVRDDSKSAAAAALTVGGDRICNQGSKSRRVSRAVAWCVVAVAAALIGVSAWAIASSGYFGASDAVGDSPAASETQDATASNISEDESEASSESSDEEAEGNASSKGGSSAEDDNDGKDASKTPSDDEDGRSSNSSFATSNSNSDSGSAAGGSSDATANSNGSAGSGSAAGSASDAQSSLITVTVTVDSSNVGSPVSYSQKLSFKKNSGATVYDALAGTGLAINSSYSSGLGSVYVSSIGGLAEKTPGYSGSGWKYFVDGLEPGVGCNQYELYDGASIVWKYVLSIGEGL